ncbi:G1/S-specific cyclin pas1 [Madurella mycetomatis]|uniref:G1/S-specific cyclin pas1 n=1 Tax=Madurella mycetomatis TaxID=100816 RepID=A0A175VPT3_9PEZI|nr:G1/S-specific cyclin pas1 [Madurella mycetomatis]
MICNTAYEPSSLINAHHNAPYNLTLAVSASASSTSTSTWSGDTTSSAGSSDTASCDSYCFSQAALSQASASSLGSSCEPVIKLHEPWPKHRIQPTTQAEAPAESRQNPRRTSNSATSRTGRPPTLQRQADRKINFVDNLVDTSTHIVEAIWPTSSVVPRNENGNGAVLPLRTFIQETLRRSRTSYSTLQVALYYLILIKPHVPAHDFTMEQPDDRRTSQAIQCGRRMFLAALILASKYLQDRNYSARAWSKISGLNTLEINQNEMTFLLAVNWKLHVTEEVYKRWADCVVKLTPTQPPSPGGAAQQIYERQCDDFRHVILNLSPDLDNLEELAPWSPVSTPTHELPPRSLYTPPTERATAFGSDKGFNLSPKARIAPVVMEPAPSTAYVAGRLAPALGLLPTPRLTPQTSGFSTPAVSAASYLLGRGSSMGFAMAQASGSVAAQSVDRWPPSATSSPMSYLTRRSSLANSVSTASSPESMISDSSRISRSSSISSASSVSAPSAKLDVQARCRYAKLCSDRLSARPTIASVPEDQEEDCLAASPEFHAIQSMKELCDVSLDLPLARRQREMDDAARALQELQRYGANRPAVQVKAGCKRSRSHSMENSVQDDVREMLKGHGLNGSSWSETMVRARGEAPGQYQHKRLCCSAEAAQSIRLSSLHPAMGGVGGPGMWAGILN